MIKKIYLIFFISLNTVFILKSNNVTLNYHRFDYLLTHIYTVLPEVFEWQIEYIKQKNIEIIDVNKLIDIYKFDNSNDTNSTIGENVLITADDGWKDVNNIIPIINKENIPLTLFIYPRDINKTSFLSINDLNNFNHLGLVNFGSHSYSHIKLKNLKNSILEQEIKVSKDTLESSKFLGKKIESFAYPYGISDSKTKFFVRKFYKIAFGLKNKINTLASDKYDLNRFIILKSTTFGEFMDIINQANNNNKKNYKLELIEENKSAYPQIKLYKFPMENKNNTILIIPSLYIGGAWLYDISQNLIKKNIESYFFISRNNNIPFHRPNANNKYNIDWGLDVYSKDLVKTLDALKDKKNLLIVTWGDGFDLLTYTLTKYKNYISKIKGVIAINPSILNDSDNQKSYEKNIKFYNKLIEKEELENQNYYDYLTIKTLSDLMILAPYNNSPFSKTFGFKQISNFDLFMNQYLKSKNNDYIVNFNNIRVEYFNNVFLNILPFLSKSIPNRVIKDLNLYWDNLFNLSNNEIKNIEEIILPVSFIYSKKYKFNLIRIKNIFKNLSIIDEYGANDYSTAEILLSDEINITLINEIQKIFKMNKK